MCLTYGERRPLWKLKRAIGVSDRRLAARLDMFGRLNRGEDMTGIEQSVIPAATGESPADGDFLENGGYLSVWVAPLRCPDGETRPALGSSFPAGPTGLAGWQSCGQVLNVQFRIRVLAERVMRPSEPSLHACGKPL